MKLPVNWIDLHLEQSDIGDRVADVVAAGMGSWAFIIIQTLIVIAWMGLHVLGWVKHWDAYPFILLNLLFSTQAAYAAPIIMMAQNRQADRDRAQAQADYQTNLDAKTEIESLQKQLSFLGTEKLDKILILLNEIKAERKAK